MTYTIYALAFLGALSFIRFLVRECKGWLRERAIDKRERDLQRYNIVAFKGTKERAR